MQVKVSKIDSETCQLTWSYAGLFPFAGGLSISFLRVFDEKDQYISVGSAIRLDRPEGSQDFKMKTL